MKRVFMSVVFLALTLSVFPAGTATSSNDHDIWYYLGVIGGAMFGY